MSALHDSLTTDDKGRVFFRGSRYLLVRPETLVAVQRALAETFGAGAAECLVAGGRAGGGAAIRTLGGRGREVVEGLLAMGRVIGWGDFALERLEPDVLVVTVRHSPFAEAHGPAAGPVCHLTPGVLEQLADGVLGRPTRVVERSCAAAGADVCRFEARVR
ncbi:MAG: hypothetical protein HY294_07280 [Candidatus Rokubacteria bacterium]|nr:hypothetical protein [Candidatus Rokubacteria bacterium]